MRETLTKIEELTRSLFDSLSKNLPEADFQSASVPLNNILSNLAILDSVLLKDSVDNKGSTDVLLDLNDQMDKNPLFNHFSSNTRAVLIQKMLNTGKPLATKEELIDFANKKVSKLSNERLIQKAYSKDEIIRIGRNSTTEKLGDGMNYNKGLEILTEELIEPANLVRVKSQAVQYMLKNPKELDQLIFEYYEI